MFSIDKKLVQTIALAALAQASADTGIIDFKEGDNVGELLNQHDFSVVSFYNAEEWAAEIDKLMDGAKEKFEKKIADGEWSDRKIGWYRADLDKHPEFAVDEFGIPDQMVYNSQAGLTRFVHYLRQFEEKEDDETQLAHIINDLTGDWFVKIQCDQIQSSDRYTYDEVVYFGPAEDLQPGGEADLLNYMVMTDIYTYDQQKVGFFYNDSNDCKKEMNLDESKRHIVFYNGLNSIPYHFTMEDDHITHDHLMFSLNTSIVKGTPRWSQRSYSALFNFWMNGIVFMMEEGALHEAELPKDDWRAALMAKVTEWTQENDSLFLPIVGHLDLNDQNRVPPLAEILGISKEDDLPHIYLIHPLTGQVAVYPEKLDDVNNYSPELIIAWAQMEVINLELENLEAQIQYAEEAEADEEGKDLYKPSEEEKKHMKEAQEHHQQAFKEAQDHYEEILNSLKEKNEFAENLQEHLEISELHMDRIQMSIYEDL